MKKRYLEGSTDTDIVNYMFGTGESESKTHFLSYCTVWRNVFAQIVTSKETF